MNEQPPILIRVEGRAGRVTLNRPKVIHALNHEMCQRMFDALMAWKDDPNVELVIVDHLPGSRGFCAGGDVKMISASGATDGVEARAFFALEYNLNTLIKHYPKPYVPIMNGVTMGGGKGIAIFGSHRVSTENSVLAMPEGNIGLFPDVGGGWFLPRLAGELGTWMALTGGRVSGIETLATGISTHYTPANTLPNLMQDLCHKGITTLDDLQSMAKPENPEQLAVLDRCFASDDVDQILCALLAEDDAWAHEQAKIIERKCPMTVKVALKQLRMGAVAQNFAQWMAMEYRIGSRMCRRPDFREGVRAVLIDKDQNPTWSPAHLSQINDQDVQAIFEPLVDELQLLPGVPNR